MASLSRNLIANFIGRSWTAALGILLIPVYIKFMGIESYGLVGFYLTLTTVFGILDLGIGSTMNRELARRSVGNDLGGSQRDLVRTLESIYWLIAIFVGLLIVLGAPFIANTWIQGQKLPPAVILRTVQLMGVSLALQFPVSLYQGGLMGLQKQVLVNVMLITHGTLRGVGAVLVLYFVSPTISSYFAWQAIVSLIGSLGFFLAIWLSLPKADKPARFKKKIIDEIWKYAAALSANALIGIVLTQLDKVILSRMLPLKMFAYFSIATTVSSIIWMIVSPFSAAAFPNLVQMHELKQEEKLKSFFHSSSQLLSLILLPVAAMLVVFSYQVLLLWMHDPVIAENCHLIVSCLVFGTMLNGISTFPVDNAMAFGWPQLITYTNLIQAAAIVPLIIVMVHAFQGVGAAIVWIILNSIYIVFMIPIFFRRYFKSEKVEWYLNDIFLPGLTAFAVCLISRQIIHVEQSRINIAVWLVCTGIITLACTALTLSSIRKRIASKFFQKKLS